MRQPQPLRGRHIAGRRRACIFGEYGEVRGLCRPQDHKSQKHPKQCVRYAVMRRSPADHMRAARTVTAHVKPDPERYGRHTARAGYNRHDRGHIPGAGSLEIRSHETECEPQCKAQGEFDHKPQDQRLETTPKQALFMGLGFYVFCMHRSIIDNSI